MKFQLENGIKSLYELEVHLRIGKKSPIRKWKKNAFKNWKENPITKWT